MSGLKYYFCKACKAINPEISLSEAEDGAYEICDECGAEAMIEFVPQARDHVEPWDDGPNAA